LITIRLETTVKSAVALAISLMRTETAELPLFGGLSLAFDRRAFAADIDRRIAEAVEAIVPAKRGRPPARRATH
jgi:hypothetical protein